MRRLAAPLLLLAATAAGAEQREIDPQDAQWAMRAAERIKACGFAQVEPRVDDSGAAMDGSTVFLLTVYDTTTATDEQFACAANVRHETGYYVEMPAALKERFFYIAEHVDTERFHIEAQDFFMGRGQIDYVPKFEPGTNLQRFADSIETLCGRSARGSLVVDPGTVSLNSQANVKRARAEDKRKQRIARGEHPKPPPEDPTRCLLYAFELSGYSAFRDGYQPIRPTED